MKRAWAWQSAGAGGTSGWRSLGVVGGARLEVDVEELEEGRDGDAEEKDGGGRPFEDADVAIDGGALDGCAEEVVESANASGDGTVTEGEGVGVHAVDEGHVEQSGGHGVDGLGGDGLAGRDVVGEGISRAAEVLDGEGVGLPLETAADPAEGEGDGGNGGGDDDALHGVGGGAEDPGEEEAEGLADGDGGEDGEGEPEDVVTLDVADFVGGDAFDLSRGKAVEEGVGEHEVSEGPDEAEDGAVDHAAVGAPEEGRTHADAIEAAHGDEGVVEGPGGDGDGVPGEADECGREDEDERDAEEVECKGGPGGGVGGERRKKGKMIPPLAECISPGAEEHEGDEDEEDLMAEVGGDVLEAGGRAVDGLPLAELTHEACVAESAVDGREGPPEGGDEGEQGRDGEHLADGGEIDDAIGDEGEPGDGAGGSGELEATDRAEEADSAFGGNGEGDLPRCVERACGAEADSVGDDPEKEKRGEDDRDGRRVGDGEERCGITDELARVEAEEGEDDEDLDHAGSRGPV